MRLVDEPVAVRVGEEGGHRQGEPATFIWRGRLYVVRDVLGHWRERRAWWTGAAARAVHGGTTSSPRPGVRPDDLPDAAEESSTVGAAGTRVGVQHEREIWRVEASAGRSFGSGVYDLGRGSGAWHLVQVVD